MFPALACPDESPPKSGFDDIAGLNESAAASRLVHSRGMGLVMGYLRGLLGLLLYIFAFFDYAALEWNTIDLFEDSNDEEKG